MSRCLIFGGGFLLGTLYLHGISPGFSQILPRNFSRRASRADFLCFDYKNTKKSFLGALTRADFLIFIGGGFVGTSHFAQISGEV